MPFRENKAVVGWVTWMVPVIREVFRHEDRHQVGGGHRGGRMARSGRCRAADAVYPELGPQIRDMPQFNCHDNIPFV